MVELSVSRGVGPVGPLLACSAENEMVIFNWKRVLYKKIAVTYDNLLCSFID